MFIFIFSLFRWWLITNLCIIIIHSFDLATAIRPDQNALRLHKWFFLHMMILQRLRRANWLRFEIDIVIVIIGPSFWMIEWIIIFHRLSLLRSRTFIVTLFISNIIVLIIHLISVNVSWFAILVARIFSHWLIILMIIFKFFLILFEMDMMIKLMFLFLIYSSCRLDWFILITNIMNITIRLIVTLSMLSLFRVWLA